MPFGKLLLIGAVLPCVACDRAAPGEPPDSIWFSHSGCYGPCPAFEIHLDRNGHGTFDGEAFTAVKGRRPLSVTPRQLDAFLRALNPALRLAKPFNATKNVYDQINSDTWCPPTATFSTDAPNVIIRWSRPNGEVYYYADYGCDNERNRKLYEALEKAPEALGLKGAIGTPNPMTPP